MPVSAGTPRRRRGTRRRVRDWRSARRSCRTIRRLSLIRPRGGRRETGARFPASRSSSPGWPRWGFFARGAVARKGHRRAPAPAISPSAALGAEWPQAAPCAPEHSSNFVYTTLSLLRDYTTLLLG